MADHTAIVTGAGRGVGRAITIALVAAGARVLAVARTLGDLERTAQLANRPGGSGLCITRQVDVTNEADVDSMVSQAESRLGRVDLMVNNAGGCRALGELWTLPIDTWWGDLELNLKSAALCSRAVLPAMLQRRTGRIVNLGSLQGSSPKPFTSAYTCAKAALVLFGESLAESVADRGVRVFTVSPGLVRTGAVEDVLSTENGRRCFPELVGTPEGRFVPPERAAAMILDIATGMADSLSGRFLHVSDDLPALVARADDIRDQDLMTMRLRR